FRLAAVVKASRRYVRELVQEFDCIVVLALASVSPVRVIAAPVLRRSRETASTHAAMMASAAVHAALRPPENIGTAKIAVRPHFCVEINRVNDDVRFLQRIKQSL